MGVFLSIAGETLMQLHFGGFSAGKPIVVDPPGFVRYWGSTTRGNGGSSIINFTPTAAHRQSGKRSTAKSDPSPYTNNRHHFPAGLTVNPTLSGHKMMPDP